MAKVKTLTGEELPQKTIGLLFISLMLSYVLKFWKCIYGTTLFLNTCNQIENTLYDLNKIVKQCFPKYYTFFFLLLHQTCVQHVILVENN